MEYKSRWYRRAELLFLVFAVILQIVSVATPGWQIVVDGNHENYSGLFYITKCKRETCETHTKHNIYLDEVSKYRELGQKELILDKDYHEEVKEQVFVIVILVSTLIILAIQICKLKNPDVRYPRLTTSIIPCLAINCGLMIDVLVDNFLQIDYMIEVSKSDYRDHRYIGFPYCIAMYIIALVSQILTIVLYTIESCKFQEKTRAPPQQKIVEDIDMSASANDYIVTTIADKESYSVKL